MFFHTHLQLIVVKQDCIMEIIYFFIKHLLQNKNYFYASFYDFMYPKYAKIIK